MLFRLISIGGLVLLLGGAHFASVAGWGLSPLRNQKLVKEMRDECPDNMRDANGNCRAKAYRSYFFMPMYVGGPRAGK